MTNGQFIERLHQLLKAVSHPKYPNDYFIHKFPNTLADKQIVVSWIDTYTVFKIEPPESSQVMKEANELWYHTKHYKDCLWLKNTSGGCTPNYFIANPIYYQPIIFNPSIYPKGTP